MKTFAEKVIAFNASLDFKNALPKGISIMNPFKENEEAIIASQKFYRKYYDDNFQRHIIFGINPGRFGSAVTGVPFTDTKRLSAECSIEYHGKQTHEPSSVFVYEMIHAFGGLRTFYKKFYINSLCPLGFTSANDKSGIVNYNYYDSVTLTEAVKDFMIESIQKQIAFGISTELAFCFGCGKNEKFFRKLNEEHHFFERIIALEHPRFIMQYKSKTKQFYIDKYLKAFKEALE